jgi:hypothetical protein
MAKSNKDKKNHLTEDADGSVPDSLSGLFSNIKIKLPATKKVVEDDDDWEMSPAELKDKADKAKAEKERIENEKPDKELADKASREPKQSDKAKSEARAAISNMLQGRISNEKPLKPAVALKSDAGDAVKKMLEGRLARGNTPSQLHESTHDETSTIVGTDAPPPPPLFLGEEDKNQLFSRVHEAQIANPLPVRKDSRYVEIIDVGEDDLPVDNPAPISTSPPVSSSTVANSSELPVVDSQLFKRVSPAPESFLPPPVRKVQQPYAQVIDVDEDKQSENNSAEEEIEFEDMNPFIQTNSVEIDHGLPATEISSSADEEIVIEGMTSTDHSPDVEIEHDLLATVLPVVDRQAIKNLKGKSIIELREEFVDGMESQHLRSLLNNSKVQAIFPHTDHNKISAFVAAIEHAKNGKDLSKILIKNNVHLDQDTINVIYAEKLMRAAIADALAGIHKGSKKLDKYNKQVKFQADKAKAVIAERNGLSVLVNYFQYKWDKILSYVVSQPRIGSGFRKFTAMFLDVKMMGGNKRTVDEIIDPDAVRERAERARPVLSDQNVSSKVEEAVEKAVDEAAEEDVMEDVDIKITSADIENNRLFATQLLALVNQKLRTCQKMQLIVNSHGSQQSYDQLVKQLGAISNEIDELKEKVILTAEQESDYEYCEEKSEKILDALVKSSNKPASVEPVKVDYLDTLVSLLKLLPRISQDKSVQVDFILDNFSFEIDALNTAQQLPLLRAAVKNISDNEVPAAIKEVLFIAIAKKVPSFSEQQAQLNATVIQEPVPSANDRMVLPLASSLVVDALSIDSLPEQEAPSTVVVNQPIPPVDNNELAPPMLLSDYNKLRKQKNQSVLAEAVEVVSLTGATHTFTAAEENDLHAAVLIAMAEESIDIAQKLTSMEAGFEEKNKIGQLREQLKRITNAMAEVSEKTELLPVEKYVLEVYTGEANRLLNNLGARTDRQDSGSKQLPLPHELVKELQAKHPGLIFKYGEEAAPGKNNIMPVSFVLAQELRKKHPGIVFHSGIKSAYQPAAVVNARVTVPEKSFSMLLTEIIGENRTPELARLLDENADLRNRFVSDGKIDRDKFKKFVKTLDSAMLEVQLGELGVSLPAHSDRLNHLRNEIATYSQPVLLPIKRNLHEKDQIKAELELSQQARTKIETPDLLTTVKDITTKIPELLKLLVDAWSLLKTVLEEDSRKAAWIDYRNRFNEIVEIYDRISDLIISTKKEYEEKLKSIASKQTHEQIKDHYEPILASLNKTESLLYHEMSSAEMVEIAELNNDISKLEKILAENHSLSGDATKEIKAAIKSLESDIDNLPEDIRADYAATKFKLRSDKVRQPIMVAPVVPGTDLDLLRESTRLLSSVSAAVRAEILIDVFNTSDISGVDKLRQLKQVENEWFNNLPEKFNWISPEQKKIMHETVNQVLAHAMSPLQAGEQEFSVILSNIIGENRTPELSRLFAENDDFRNRFINGGIIDTNKLQRFVKSLDSSRLEEQLREVDVTLPAYSDRLNNLRNEVATYSQPVLIPIKRNMTEKEQINTELELSHQKPLKIETPELLATIEGIKKKIPELLKSLIDARNLLGMVSDQDPRTDAWSGYRESYNNVFEVYDQISNLIISTKSEYEEKLKSTDSKYTHGKLKDHYEPILASLNKSEILLYQEMNSSEIIEIRELTNDKFKLEKQLAHNASMSDADILEIKAEIESIENDIAALPEDIRIEYAATQSRFPSDRIRQPRIVLPLVPGTDLDLLRESSRLISSVNAEFRAEILIDLFNTPGISGKEKLEQLKQIESEWFSNLPEKFQWITETQMKIMRDTVDLVLGNTVAPSVLIPEDERASVEIDSSQLDSIEDDDEYEDELVDSEEQVLPKSEEVKHYKSGYDPRMRNAIPDPTILRIGKYPEQRSLPKAKNSIKYVSEYDLFQSLPPNENQWGEYLSQNHVKIDHNLFASTMRMLTEMNKRDPDYSSVFWNAMSAEKKLSVIDTITYSSELTGILHALKPEWRSQFLSLVPQSKLDEILVFSHNLGSYVSELYKLGLDEFVDKIDPELVKSAVQIFVDLDLFDRVPVENRNTIANMFVKDYLNQRVQSADELARSIAKIVKYGLFDQIKNAGEILSAVIKNETDLYIALQELSVVDKAFFMSHISQSQLFELATNGSNANQMAAAFSLLPVNSLNDLIDSTGEDWLVRLLANVTNIESYVSLIEKLPDDMRTKLLFDESTQKINIHYHVINNIKNYDNLTRLLVSLKDDHLKEAFLNQLKENSIDFINDTDFTDTYYRSIYIDYLNRIPATGDISDEALADLLLAAKPEERKAIFNQHTKPSVLKLLSHDEKDIVNLLKALPSAKWRNEFSNDTNDENLKKKASNFNNITSLHKLKSYERAASRLMKSDNTSIFISDEEKNEQFYEAFKADYISQLQMSIDDLKKQFGYMGRLLNSEKYKEKLNDLYAVHETKLKELLDMQANDKLSNKGILIFDLEKILLGAQSAEDRLAAVNSIANIIKYDGNIQQLQINLARLEPAEIKILSQAFSERTILNHLPQIQYLDIHCGDNCPLEAMSQFLKSYKIESYNLHAVENENDKTEVRLAMRTVLSLSDHQKKIIESEVEHAISSYGVASADVSACESTANAYKEIKGLFEISDATYLGYTHYPVRFDNDSRHVCDGVLSFIENRNTQPRLANAAAVGLTVNIPVNNEPDITGILSPLSSPSSISESENSLSVSSVASTTQEYSDSDSSLESSTSSRAEDGFNYQTTDRDSPNESPRSFSFNATDEDRLHSEIISLCREYDDQYKERRGKILDVKQLEMLAEIVSHLRSSLDGDNRINQTLKSIHILNLSGLQEYITAENSSDIARWTADIVRNNSHVRALELPYDNFSENDIKPIADVFAEAEPSERVKVLTLSRANNNSDTEGVALILPILENLKKVNATTSITIANPYPLNKLQIVGNFRTPEGESLNKLYKDSKGLIKFDNHTNSMVGVNTLAIRGPAMFNKGEITHHNRKDALPPLKLPTGKNSK